MVVDVRSIRVKDSGCLHMMVRRDHWCGKSAETPLIP